MTAPPSSPPPRIAPTGLPRRRIALIGTLALALVAGGIVAWSVLRGGPGADSPEEAVREFVAAVTAQDAVAALAVVNPAEVVGLAASFGRARQRLEDVGLTGGGRLLDAVDLRVDDLDVEVEQLADDLARVVPTRGLATIALDPERLPERLGDLTAVLEETTLDGSPEAFENIYGVPPAVLTVRVEGRWYVSLLASALDLQFGDAVREFRIRAYGDEGLVAADYAESDEYRPRISATPQAVLSDLATLVDGGQVAALVDALPEGLAIALRPYASIVQEYLVGVTVTSASLEDLDVDVEDVGDGLTRLTIDRAVARLDFDDITGEPVSVGAELVGDCGTAQEYQPGGSVVEDSDSACLPAEFVRATGIDRATVMVREVEGGYQLDPAATVVDYLDRVVQTLPDSLLEQGIDLVVEEIRYEVGSEDDSTFTD
ncbi:hypothetical protein [Nocardioides sp.]|uniref:hypothetical protein n=1 Tax=Nocardioides sp. TaxID=35761 RepID=UPI003513E899